MQPEPAIRPYLEQLRTLPFIRDLDFSAPGRDTNPEVEPKQSGMDGLRSGERRSATTSKKTLALNLWLSSKGLVTTSSSEFPTTGAQAFIVLGGFFLQCRKNLPRGPGMVNAGILQRLIFPPPAKLLGQVFGK
jgi:hypothetical protein